jgi:hypothetical protein
MDEDGHLQTFAGQHSTAGALVSHSSTRLNLTASRAGINAPNPVRVTPVPICPRARALWGRGLPQPRLIGRQLAFLGRISAPEPCQHRTPPSITTDVPLPATAGRIRSRS